MSSFRAGLRDLMREISGGSRSGRSPARDVQLLMQHLSEVQRNQYAWLGYFHVIGGDTGRLYRIRRGSMMNVELLDKSGKQVCTLCFIPDGRLPLGDVMLAQKIALELFESEAIRIANATIPKDWLRALDPGQHRPLEGAGHPERK